MRIKYITLKNYQSRHYIPFFKLYMVVKYSGNEAKIIPMAWLKNKGKKFHFLRNGKNFEEQSPRTIMNINDRDLEEAEWEEKFGPFGKKFLINLSFCFIFYVIFQHKITKLFFNNIYIRIKTFLSLPFFKYYLVIIRLYWKIQIMK